MGEQHGMLFAQHLDHLQRVKQARGEGNDEKQPAREAQSRVNGEPPELVNTEEGVELYLQRLRVIVNRIVQTEEQKRRTFVFFRGTAGMRDLSDDQRKSLLEKIRAALSTWGFQLPAGSTGVSILEGSEEGVMRWLMLNQLLGNFDGANQLIRVDPDHLMRQKANRDSNSSAPHEDSLDEDAPKSEKEARPVELGSATAEDPDVRKQPKEKRRAGLIEMGGDSAQVVIQIPSDLRPSNVYSPLFSRVDLVHKARGNKRGFKALLPPIRSHRPAGFPGSSVEDFTEVDLCTERQILYAKSYVGLAAACFSAGHRRGVVEHIHETVQHAFEQRKTAIREGRAVPPTRERPFEVSIPCLPSDVRAHVQLSHLRQKPAFDSGLFMSLHDQGDLRRDERETETQADSTKPWRATRYHPAGVPQTRESSDALNRRMKADRGAGLMDSIHHIAVQGASDTVACTERVALTSNGIPAFPFTIHPEIPLYATEDFNSFKELVLPAGQPQFSGAKLAQEATRLCKIRQVEDVAKAIHVSAGRETAQTACFGLVLMSQFLTRVLRLERERAILAVNAVDGIETSWTAAIPMLYLAHVIKERKQRSPPYDGNLSFSSGGSASGTESGEPTPFMHGEQNQKERRDSDMTREEL
ncbi:GDA1/CD39 (nucleoside phosphatase) family domain containing protein [Neospora caninum Liverpool]|nr:GDA1/CD39 (nucleoside phosphatase) family domain containing protein [Neospora caninum Liverpool]CBZ52907.1 GDA1/CD39 (nucleoside phosphatase) family domain containing protein [Neospora caninum Liverpool]|eukprot:XP_003882939.1 GDA1/CD39 (nucleoside phosphatase) family domain containing protein [Neospora caninum Liverpool]